MLDYLMVMFTTRAVKHFYKDNGKLGGNNQKNKNITVKIMKIKVIKSY